MSDTEMYDPVLLELIPEGIDLSRLDLEDPNAVQLLQRIQQQHAPLLLGIRDGIGD